MDGPTTLRNKACSFLQASSHFLQEADRVYIAILAFGNRERDKGPLGSSLGIQIIFEHRPSRAAIRLPAISNFVPPLQLLPVTRLIAHVLFFPWASMTNLEITWRLVRQRVAAMNTSLRSHLSLEGFIQKSYYIFVLMYCCFYLVSADVCT